MNEIEQKWIKIFDSFRYGYNETIGGDNWDSWARKIPDEDVLNIRKRRLSAENFSDVYADYPNIP